MKIDQLIYFTETAKEEHIGRAANILGISPSAISHSIASLEGELQVKLFQKKGKNIFLTAEGKKLLDKSFDLVAQFKNLKSELLSKDSDQTHYAICASHAISSKYIAPTWRELQKTYSIATIDLLTLRSADVIKNVLNRKSDIGVCFSPQSHPDLEMTIVYQGELLINVRNNHPILKNKKNSLNLLNNYDAVLPKAFEGIDICIQHPMFKKFGITPKPTCLIDSYDTSSELIRNSNYWGLSPDLLVDPLKTKVIKPNKGWHAPFNISVIWRKNQFVPNFFNDFVGGLINQLNGSKK